MKSQMQREPKLTELEFRADLDRLVSGDLDEATRNALLRYLEQNPAQWRECALAFLEAQLWSEALNSTPSAARFVAQVPIAAVVENDAATVVATHYRVNQPRRPRAWVNLATAAVVLIAFASGWLLEKANRMVASGSNGSSDVSWESNADPADNPVLPQPTETAETDIVWATRELPRSSSLPGARLQIPLNLKGTSQAEPELKLSTYEKQLLARRGLEVAKQRRFINANLPDGTAVAVPIDQIVVKRVNNEIN